MAVLIGSLDDSDLAMLADRLTPHLRVSRAPEDGWMPAREAAAYLGTTLDALYKLTSARRVPFAQDGPGCRLWFRRSDLDAWREAGGRA
jgi:excisionase family DNA binding protein